MKGRWAGREAPCIHHNGAQPVIQDFNQTSFSSCSPESALGSESGAVTVVTASVT